VVTTISSDRLPPLLPGVFAPPFFVVSAAGTFAAASPNVLALAFCCTGVPLVVFLVGAVVFFTVFTTVFALF
jgi:hypothetical protein